jgi:DNA transformation protein
MPVSEGFLEFVLDQLSEAGEVSARRMFGGVGLYLEDVFFGLIAGDVLYFKVDDSTRGRYQEAGSQPFRPYGEESYSMGYYGVPADILDDREALRDWARQAAEVAARARLERGARTSPRRAARKTRSRHGGSSGA